MPVFTTASSLALLVITATQVHTLVIPAKRSSYSFNSVVAFGDELTDNGNGSWAHGIAGGPDNAKIYGFGTWTDGPVAVSYLADMLNMPLTDYAFGGCCGGTSGGSTINNTYTGGAVFPNGSFVPSVHDQVFYNYTLGDAAGDASNALQFLWTGQVDMMMKADWFWESDPKNADFAFQISDRIRYNAEHLIDQGAPYVFVPNIYPKHKAPVTTTFLCSDGSCVDTFGSIIQTVNSAIESQLNSSKYADKLIYYDTFGFMMNVMDNKDSYGLTQPLTYFCDGNSSAKWDICAAGAQVWDGAKQFFWMTFTQPTTTVHQLVAQDMKKTLDSFLGM